MLFRSGVDGALLAPTALNKQDFMLIGNGNRVKIHSGSELSSTVSAYLYTVGKLTKCTWSLAC